MFLCCNVFGIWYLCVSYYVTDSYVLWSHINQNQICPLRSHRNVVGARTYVVHPTLRTFSMERVHEFHHQNSPYLSYMLHVFSQFHVTDLKSFELLTFSPTTWVVISQDPFVCDWFQRKLEMAQKAESSRQMDWSKHKKDQNSPQHLVWRKMLTRGKTRVAQKFARNVVDYWLLIYIAYNL